MDKQSRIEKYEALAAKAQHESNAAYQRSHNLLDPIPFGQPNINGRLTGVLNRAHSAMDKSCKFQSKADYYKSKAEAAANNNAIYSDDPEAVQKIKDKIAYIETAPDKWGYNKTEIRRLKERLLELAPEEVKAGKQITINGTPATFESIVEAFNAGAKNLQVSHIDESHYLSIPFIIADEKRKYKCYLSNQVNADCTELATWGNADNGYKTIWKPLDDMTKFNLMINQMSGSGNKAVIYSMLKDLIKKDEPETIIDNEIAINGESARAYENEELARLQIFFENVPSAETRNILKSNGFKWAPSQNAWQRLLNANAKYALKRIIAQ